MAFEDGTAAPGPNSGIGLKGYITPNADNR